MTDQSVIILIVDDTDMGRARSKIAGSPPWDASASKAGVGKAVDRRGGKVDAEKTNNTRAQRSAARREAILAAALEEFSAHGFEAARLDDVAKRAGIAKGTIYLYFRDKEELFQALVRSYISPVVGTLEHVAYVDAPIRSVAEQLADLFVREIVETRRKDIIRLILSEGPRFPKLAEFYYREVISRALVAVRGVLSRAFERGEITSDVLVRFPQLLIAPGLVAIMWKSLFDRYDPLDVRAMMRAHFDFIFSQRRGA